MATWRLLKDGEIPDLWASICQESDAATFFHTSVWANVLAKTFRQWTPRPVAMEFSDGNRMVLPLMQRKSLIPGGYYLESMPPGVYGGPLFTSEPAETHTRALLEALDDLSNVIVLGNPFGSQIVFPDDRSRSLYTHVLDLSVGVERVVKNFRKGHAANISAARRKGVEISVASRREDVDAYFDIYQNTLSRWGDKAGGFYPKRLFQNLFDLPEYGQSIRLWLAKYKGNVASGAWVFYHKRHAVYWHGAMHSDYAQYHPVHLMLAEAIGQACRDNFRWFDFNPSGGLKGVEHFKRGFGATPMPFFSYRRLGPAGRAFRLQRYIKETVLHTCPV